MNTPIVQLREKKKDILLILATVIFLAVSINFSTSFLSEIFSNYPMILFILCALCFVAGILLLNKIAFSLLTTL